MEPKFKRVYWPKIQLVFICFFIAILFFVGWKLVAWGQQFKKETGLTATAVFQLIFQNGVPLAASDGHTNILVLGMGGGMHQGADLTDTMLVVSLDQKNHTVALISVPRDIWSDTLKDKINSAYHYGEEKKKGGGLVLAKAITEDVVGLPIQHSFVIDFSGFTKIIDLVGGVDVIVPTAFTDTQFPIEGKENDPCGGDPEFACRYETLQFTAGLQHMDGTLALKYVRSRHAEGEEGSDFARSRRQQDVLVALKQKVLQSKFFFSPTYIVGLLRSFDEATDMDMNIGELLTVGKLLATTKSQAITKISFQDLLTSPPLYQYGGRYVLLPQEDFAAIHTFIRKKLFGNTP